MLPPKRNKIAFGSSAEDFALKLLRSLGYKILEKNFRSRFGEIDIIAKQEDTLIFVEVKARKSVRFGFPEEAVTREKLRRIRLTGEYYFATHKNLPQKQRIDVVSLVIIGEKVTSSRIIRVY